MSTWIKRKRPGGQHTRDGKKLRQSFLAANKAPTAMLRDWRVLTACYALARRGWA